LVLALDWQSGQVSLLLVLFMLTFYHLPFAICQSPLVFALKLVYTVSEGSNSLQAR